MPIAVRRFTSPVLAMLAFLGTAAVAQAQLLVSEVLTGNLVNINTTNGTATPLITGGLAFPAGMAVGADNFLYISNQATNTIDRYTAGGAFVNNVVSLGSGYAPGGIRFNPANPNELFISKLVSQPFAPVGSGAVDKFNISTNMLTNVVSGLTQPSNVLFDPMNPNRMLIAELSNYVGQVREYNLTTMALSTLVPNTVGGLVAPSGLALGPGNTLLVADPEGQAVRQYTLAGAPIGTGVFASGANVNRPADILVDGGTVYVANLGDFMGPTGFISRFDGAGTPLGQLGPNLNGASALAIQPVPEPSTLLLCGLVATAAAFRRFRR